MIKHISSVRGNLVLRGAIGCGLAIGTQNEQNHKQQAVLPERNMVTKRELEREKKHIIK